MLPQNGTRVPEELPGKAETGRVKSSAVLKERQTDLKQLPVSTVTHARLIALDVDEPILRL
jgi:hypothetical protein